MVPEEYTENTKTKILQNRGFGRDPGKYKTYTTGGGFRHQKIHKIYAGTYVLLMFEEDVDPKEGEGRDHIFASNISKK